MANTIEIHKGESGWGGPLFLVPTPGKKLFMSLPAPARPSLTACMH